MFGNIIEKSFRIYASKTPSIHQLQPKRSQNAKYLVSKKVC